MSSPGKGIQLSGIILSDAAPAPENRAARYAIEPDPFGVELGQAGFVVAPPAARKMLADGLAGLAVPDAGTIVVRGSPVTGLPAGQRGIALIPAGGGLLPHLTVASNTGFALSRHEPKNARRARVEHALERLQLTNLRNLRPHELSDEQRLRVAVARALCPGDAWAAVIEDCGTPACGAAVEAAVGEELAVLVIIGSEVRADEIGISGRASAGSGPQPVPGTRKLAFCRPAEEVPGAPSA